MVLLRPSRGGTADGSGLGPITENDLVDQDVDQVDNTWHHPK